MENPWYSFYVGDYARDTAHLSLLEHGAFRLLLDHYYATRQPLPNDSIRLCRICRAKSPSERKAVTLVASQFFIEDGSLLRNGRCDSEIDKLLKYSDRQSAAAKIRHSRGSAVAVPRVRVPQSQPQPRKLIDPFYSPEFELFWNAYPKHNGSKQDAARSFNRVIMNGVNYGTVIEGAQRYRGYIERCKKGPEFTAHAGTWLNQSRWTVEYSGGEVAASKPTWASETERLRAKYTDEAAREGDFA